MSRTGRLTKWELNLLSALQNADARAPYGKLYSELKENKPGCGIHLAVLVEPYLSLILDGKKTIESRFSLNRHAPFEQVHEGDIIILKRSSGPVEGICRVADAWFYRLNPDTWPDVERHAGALCMDDSAFWKQKRGASYASLMRIDQVMRLPSFTIDKPDPRGWVVLRPNQSGDQECLF